MTLREVMTKNVETVEPNTTLKEAGTRMRDRDIGLLAVLDGGKISGTLTDRDICVNAVAGGLDPERQPVSKAMTAHAVTCDVGEKPERAAELMAEHKVRRLVVTEDGAPTGVVSLGDLSRALSDKELAGRTLQEVS